MGKVCWVRINLNGIYSWGKGYESRELHDAWKKFFSIEGKHPAGYYIGISDKGSATETDFISDEWGSFYCHPMEITGITRTTSSSDDFSWELGHLAKFTDDLCSHIEAYTGIKPTYNILYRIQDETREEYKFYKETA